jgi:hypothetical protein
MSTNASAINKNRTRLAIPNQVDAFLKVKNKIEAGVGVREACREVVDELNLNISPGALACKFYRMNQSGGKIRSNMIFTSEEEEMFVGLLEGFSLLNRPLTRRAFISHVITLRPNLTNWNPSGWCNRFFSRHHERISMKTVNGIKSSRVSKSTYTDVKGFVNHLERFLFERNIEEKLIFNADETRMSLLVDNHVLKAIEYIEKGKYSIISNANHKCATYIPFHCYNKLMMSFVVIPLEKSGATKFSLREVKNSRREGAPVFYLFTESGWLNSEAWVVILKRFQEEIQKIQKIKRFCCYLIN